MDYRIGLDMGIASVGWAVLENDSMGEPKRIVNLGVRIFDKAETTEGDSLAAARRGARCTRRRLRRRKHRLDRIKDLLQSESWIDKEAFMERYYQGDLPDVYWLRYEALNRMLQPEEFAQVLIHIAKHRGFRSTRKSELKEEGGKVLTATTENKRLMEEKNYRTVGEMMYLDDKFRVLADWSETGYLHVTRNKKGDYNNTVLRSMLIDEVNLIFEKQREFGNRYADEQVQEKYLEIMCSQRSFDMGPGNQADGTPSPYAGNLIEKMIGRCTFEPKELRAAKACYTSERFVLLQKLSHLRVRGRDGIVAELEDSQRLEIVNLVYQQKKVTYAAVRKLLKLGTDYVFNDLTYSEIGVNREASIQKTEKAVFAQMTHFHEIREALGNYDIAKCTDAEFIEVLDEIGNILSKYKNDDTRREKLNELPISDKQIESLLELNPSKFQHLSLKAMRKMMPYLEQGLVYNMACEEAGYQFKAEREGERLHTLRGKEINDIINNIPNPVVKRSVSQTFKVLNAIIAEYGSPQSVHIELARDIAKKFDERKKIETQMKNNQNSNEKIKQQLQEWGVLYPSGQDILKFRLWQEQGECCMYTGEHIPRERLFEKGVAEIDHIIPYSLCYDDSMNNKVLVKAVENQNKGNRIPYEYFGANSVRWSQFEQRVNEKIKNYKKLKRLLKKSLTEEELKAFKTRNLNDTRYMTTLVYNIINDYLEFAPYIGNGKIRKVFAVNGSITSYLRKRWGLLPKDRTTDTHHAVDAVIVACCTNGMIQKITRNLQSQEMRRGKGLKAVDPETGELICRDDYTEEQWIQKFGARIPKPWKWFQDELAFRMSSDPQSFINNQWKEYSKFDYPEGEEQKIKPIFVSRMPNHKVNGAERADTVRSPRHFEELGIVLTKVELTELKLDKDGEIRNYYNPSSDRLLYEALKAQLHAYGGDGKKAFQDKFYKPKADGSKGPLVRKVKIWDRMTVGVAVNGSEDIDSEDAIKMTDRLGRNLTIAGLAANGAMVRVDVFRVEKRFYFVPIYISDTKKRELPNGAVLANKPYRDWLPMKEEDFIFSLYPNDLFYFKHKTGMKGKTNDKHECIVNERVCYFKGANISTASFSGLAHDSSFSFESLGIQSLLELKKYQVDVLGNVMEVKKETRMRFS